MILDILMDEYNETIKTVGELSKLGTKSLDSVDRFGGVLSKALGVPAKDVYGIVGDQLNYIQWELRQKLADKINIIHEKRGHPPVRPVLPKFVVPIILNASFETDEELHDLWCKLLANGMDSTRDLELRYAYIEMIKSLSSLDVSILNTIYANAINYANGSGATLSSFPETQQLDPANLKRMMGYFSASYRIIMREVGCSEDEFKISINNLLRIQCLKMNDLDEVILAVSSLSSADDLNFIDIPTDSFSITPLGFAFIEACIK